MEPNLNMNSLLSILALLFLQLILFHASFSNGRSTCIPSEREALLRFKHDLTDPSNRLASWSGNDGHEDCCQWTGVVCDNSTGHILQLHLSNPYAEYNNLEYYIQADFDTYERSKLGGKINPSLLDLKELIHLDLSFNDFRRIRIPEFFGSLEKLRYLNLSRAEFGGMIPPQLGNLSKLQYLDLHDHMNSYVFSVENLRWVSSLDSLKHLDLSGLNQISSHSTISSLSSLEVLILVGCDSTLLTISNLSSLTTLDLTFNVLGGTIPSWIFRFPRLKFLGLGSNFFEDPIPQEISNLTELTHLDLSQNRFSSSMEVLSTLTHLDYLSLWLNDLQGSVPSFLGNMTSITSLDLSSNRLEGRIPTSFGRLCKLKSISMSGLNLQSDVSQILDIFSGCVSETLVELDMSNCGLFGNLSDEIGRFRSLETLDLSNNSIYGPIPASIGQLSSLKRLYLSKNKLNATISESHLGNLTKLVYLRLGDNPLIGLNVDLDWVAPFQLLGLDLGSCNLGPRFPSWIRSQKSLYSLDISNNGISDAIPYWFWKSLGQFSLIDFSRNEIYQVIPNVTNGDKLMILDLSSNKFIGPLPHIYPTGLLDLSSNAFSGSLTGFFCYGVNESRTPEVLNLENNSLSGGLPNCGWEKWRNLGVLNLGNNKFSGKLPVFIGNLTSLAWLILRKNNFSDTMPIESLQDCTRLVILDISENSFAGNVDTLIAQRVSGMKVLNIRSNKFQGSLPIEICRLSSLQILDLSNNHLSGIIPHCINNLQAMIGSNSSVSVVSFYNIPIGIFGRWLPVSEHQSLVNRGMTYNYSSNLNLVRVIDLSRNKFSGEIPEEITSLSGLWSLNLSHNLLTGRIPDTIDDMGQIQNIDFSVNQLSGEIPPSITGLTFLSFLNVSNNKLTGRIPLGTQLQTMDASCFRGNDLYGCPLPIGCNVSNRTPLKDTHGGDQMKEGDEHGVKWFYIGLPFGFVVGFWSFIGPLLANRRWRYRYYAFLDRLGDEVYFVKRKFM